MNWPTLWLVPWMITPMPQLVGNRLSLTGKRSGSLHTNDDDQCAAEHAGTPSGLVKDRADKGQRSNATNLEDGGYDPGPHTTVGPVVCFEKPRVLEQVVDEGPVVASDGAVEEGNDGEEVDKYLRTCPWSWRLLYHSLIVGLIAGDDLGFGGIFLLLLVLQTRQKLMDDFKVVVTSCPSS